MPARQGHKTPGENDLDADFERGLRSIFLYSLLYTTLGYSNFHDAWIEFSESLSIQKGFFTSVGSQLSRNVKAPVPSMLAPKRLWIPVKFVRNHAIPI